MQNHKLKFKIGIKERAYQYSVSMIEFLDALPKDISMQIIVKQLLRSATSIGANIIEAQASSSKRDFINYMHHSLKSANESLYWLNLLKDAKKVSDNKLELLLGENKELANILGASLLTLKGKNRF